MNSIVKKHLNNARYLALHKWYVFRAGLKTKAPLWRLVVHDWSKLLPSEWFPYANYFFNEKLKKEGYFHQPGNDNIFDRAWLNHIHRNPHHWQHWVLREDEGATKILEMPENFVREMVADWLGAGRTQTGKWGVQEWYDKNKPLIKLHDKSRELAERIIDEATKKMAKKMEVAPRT